MIVKKKRGKQIEAYKLAEEGPVIRKLMKEGLIVEKEDGSYEVFSQEAVNGTGEIAAADDYIKVDSSGRPYPNSPDFFKRNHKKTGENLYEQIPNELQA